MANNTNYRAPPPQSHNQYQGNGEGPPEYAYTGNVQQQALNPGTMRHRPQNQWEHRLSNEHTGQVRPHEFPGPRRFESPRLAQAHASGTPPIPMDFSRPPPNLQTPHELQNNQRFPHPPPTWEARSSTPMAMSHFENHQNGPPPSLPPPPRPPGQRFPLPGSHQQLTRNPQENTSLLHHTQPQRDGRNSNLPPTHGSSMLSSHHNKGIKGDVTETTPATTPEDNVLDSWLSKRSKKANVTDFKTSNEPPKKSNDLTVSEVRQLLTGSLSLLRQLTEHKERLMNDVQENDMLKWQEDYTNAVQVKNELEKLQKGLSGEKMERFVRKRQLMEKKRKRIQCQKREEYVRRVEEEAEKNDANKRIDDWLNKVQLKLTEAKREKELKATADATLAEIRRKLSDSEKTRELLQSMLKLRQLRKERNENQGLYTSKESDRHFETSVASHLALMAKQHEVYLREETTLKVMLETEKEENLEREKELAEQKKREKERQKVKKIEKMLFGKPEPLDQVDPLFPFRQYYIQAETNLDSLLQIRSEWDSYLVDDRGLGGSRVPQGWVMPSEPSSDIWASVLHNQ